ncbi:DUF58 domain-containing protein [Paenibacillus terrigena]|uniref:DUF58 domain-containing protein n=1 Tax=Paenibacillus terrigena TaxID=369333 RepID=UPI0028D8B1C1|nr:DUF58 domain-containing protein [Paenibacillus terrigena]
MRMKPFASRFNLRRSGKSAYSLRFWMIVTIWCVCLLFFLFQGGKTSFMLLAMMSVLCLYLWIGRWSGISKSTGKRELLYEGEHRLVFHAGDSIEAQLTIKVQPIGITPYVLLRDQLVRRHGETKTFESLVLPDWSRQCVMRYNLSNLRRGFYSFGESECAMEDVIGLFQHKATITVPTQFSVLPHTVRIPKWKIFDSREQGFGRNAFIQRSTKETTQINGVREYIYGDRISRIHWNATAKTGHWKSKEFERESLPSMMLILDRTQRHYYTEEQFELAISVAASLLAYGRERHIPLGLISLGKTVETFEAGSSAHQQRLMNDHLMETEADGYQDLSVRLQQMGSKSVQGSFYVLISPSANDKVLRLFGFLQQKQMGVSHIHLTDPDGASQDNWSAFLMSRGIPAYSIRQLQELPVVLGGWANGQVAASSISKS